MTSRGIYQTMRGSGAPTNRACGHPSMRVWLPLGLSLIVNVMFALVWRTRTADRHGRGRVTLAPTSCNRCILATRRTKMVKRP
eukprot:11989272-Heterocapsa_arctica.AAC.1